MNLNISFSQNFIPFSLVGFSVEAEILCSNSCHQLRAELKREDVSGQFVVTVKEWKSQEDQVAQGFFFHNGDVSTREMLSSWCPGKSILRPPCTPRVTISAYGLNHCAFIEQQEEYAHCSGESHQAAQMCFDQQSSSHFCTSPSRLLVKLGC